MKGYIRFLLALMSAPLLCGAAFVAGYVVLVALTIPQLPAWAQPGVTKWLMDVPQDTETSDNGVLGDSAPAGMSLVAWDGYIGPGSTIHGLPLIGPIQHWSEWHERPLLGCIFQDPHYRDHTGADFPVNEGTPIHATISGKVVWAGENGPWGNLVVIENDGVQVWLAHLSVIEVAEGQILGYEDVVGLSGDTGNSSGPHLHYAIKQRTEAGGVVWLNPQLYMDPQDLLPIGCGG